MRLLNWRNARSAKLARLVFVSLVGAIAAGCAANKKPYARTDMDAPSALTRTAAYDPAARSVSSDRFARPAVPRPVDARDIDPIEPFSPDYGSVDAETARTLRGDDHWQAPIDSDLDGDVSVPGYSKQ